MLMTAAILAMGLQADDPLAPSLEGKFACVAPDRAARTCGSTMRYERNGDGTYRTTTTILVASEPRTTIVGQALVTAGDGMVCQIYDPETIDSAQIFVDDAPASEAVTAHWRNDLKRNLTGFVGQKICAIYRQDGDLVRTEAVMDGEPVRGGQAVLIWVSPDEGYTLR